jgi:type IV secretion system protein VirD4
MGPIPGRALLGLLAALAGIALTFWLAASLAALVFGGGWLGAGPADAATALVAMPDHLGEPARAWTRPERARMSDAFGFYLTLGSLLLVLGIVAGALVALRPRLGSIGGREVPPAAQWATPGDLRRLLVRGPQPGRVILGRIGATGRLVACEPRTSVMVVAPSQSWKTSAIATPALLEWEGPVIATSVKTDLLRHTLGRRQELGNVWVFDPSGSTNLASSSWSPLTSCGTWRGAQRMAHWLATAARPERAGISEAEFWYSASAKLLGPLLYAAATSGRTMADVVRWIDSQDELEPTEALDRLGEPEPTAAYEASCRRDERQRSSIYTTTETVLAAYADPHVLEVSRASDVRPAELLDGGSHALYLCAPAHEQRRLAPLFAAMLEEIVSCVYETAAASGSLDPPLLFVGDELANIAPLRRLPELASTGGGQGIQLISIFQDLAQVRERWGEGWRTVANNHRAKLFGGGAGDPQTLDYVGQLTGDTEYRQLSSTSAEHGRQSSTDAPTFRALAPAHVVREAGAGEAILVYGNAPAGKLRLRSWYRDRRLKSLAVDYREEHATA